MALDAGIVWEMRTTGSLDNGGGFKTGASGTDYSQQAAPQWALSGITTAGAGATFLTASAAATMVGNVCKVVSGTNFTVGWYEITSVSVGTSVTVDRNCCTGAGADGVINIGGAVCWGVGGTEALPDDAFIDTPAIGNTVWIQAGTYTLRSATSRIVSGSTTALTWLLGYNSTRGDNPTGDNRPLIECGANIFSWGSSRHAMANLRFTTTAAQGVTFYYLAVNCKAVNSSGTAGRAAFYNGDICVGCEATSANGVAFSGMDELWFCFGHDSVTGVNDGGGFVATFCVFDTCSGYGVSLDGINPARIFQCTIYNCGTGIYRSSSTSYDIEVLNCIIQACTTGIAGSTACATGRIFHNHFYNNTTDISNYTEHLMGNLYTDPGMNDPANDDFSIGISSNAYQVGLNFTDWITGVTV